MTTLEVERDAKAYMLRVPSQVRRSYWYVVLFENDKPIGYAHSAWNKQSALVAGQRCLADMTNGKGIILKGSEILK